MQKLKLVLNALWMRMLLVIDETMKMKGEITGDCWVFKGDLQKKGNPRD